MFGKHARRALHSGVLLLALALTAGCGGDGEGDGGGGSWAQPGGDATQEGTSGAKPSGPLYTDKTATLSNAWAVKRGCPTSVYLEFRDDGPHVTDSPAKDHPQDDGGTWPSIRWIPPCSAPSKPVLYFDDPVAKVSGSQTPSSCRADIRNALGDGSWLDAYSGRNLAAGDEFCTEFEEHRQVVHFRVTKVSGTPAREIDWSVSAWRTPDEPAKKESYDEPVYKDLPLTLSEEASEANDCAVGHASVFSKSPILKYVKGSMADADILYFPDCLSSPKIRFGERTTPVDGDVGASACVDAVANAAENTGDLELSELKAGQRYCSFSSDRDAVALIKVVELTTGPSASVKFSVTSWKVPEPQ
ncbi:hypothetical protein HCJ93_23155 [Streptomyces sp. SBST2-5]|uniref:Secreted protein n=1 Tax=Streptomyces composti TaxID=2720025 RepID=A0ABX1ADY7_9ACTN|nr:hypothetical protein [Streptomyces composti]NJP52884.1 hypothetical protein [Streptomyces composti]